MNPIAQELNDVIIRANNHVYEMLSEVGKNLYFPKGILTQSAEAKEKASLINATIGMAKEQGRTMYLPSVMTMINGLEPEETLTYAPSFGSLPLRQAWKAELLEKNPSLASKPISLPVVTNALTHGLSVLADMWIDPGDTLILPDKNWGNYSLIFAVRRGANMVQYPLFDGGGHFNVEALKRCALAEAERADKLVFMLNFPNNPTGYMITPYEAEQIARIILDLASAGKKIVAISDDAYFGLFYDDDILKESIFSLITGRDAGVTAIKVDGATKENYAWGLRVGFITYGLSLEGDSGAVHDALEKKTAGAVRGSISNVSHLSQSIVLKLLESGTYIGEKDEKYRIMKERALEVKRVLADTKYEKAWDVYPFNAGYFMCLRLKTVEAEPLRVHLLEKYGVGLISLGKRDMRIAFSCVDKQDIRKLFDTVYDGVEDLKA